MAGFLAKPEPLETTTALSAWEGNMPAKSEAQRRKLNAKFGHAWVKEHHFDNKGSLPEHVGDKKVQYKQPGGHMKEGSAREEATESPAKECKEHKAKKKKRMTGDPDASAQHKAMNKKHGCGIAGY